jgi:hypothetical protein
LLDFPFLSQPFYLKLSYEEMLLQPLKSLVNLCLLLSLNHLLFLRYSLAVSTSLFPDPLLGIRQKLLVHHPH